MGKFINLTGKRFGKLVVIEFAYIKNKKTFWKLKCDCGKIIIHRTDDLHENSSCGCYTSELMSKVRTKHGLHNHRLKTIYYSMLTRCYKKNCKAYKYYGGRNIIVCTEWKNNFMNFYNWAINNGYKDNLTLDRTNVNGNYEPDNCRWATRKEQMKNIRNNINITWKNKTQCLTEWAKELDIKQSTLSARIKKLKWTIEKAFITPVSPYRKKN